MAFEQDLYQKPVYAIHVGTAYIGNSNMGRTQERVNIHGIKGLDVTRIVSY